MDDAPGLVALFGVLDVRGADKQALYATLGAFRAAVAHCEEAGRTLGTTANALLHQHCYADLRRLSGLPANLVIRAVAVAARRLKEHANAPPDLEYDSRVARVYALSTNGERSPMDYRLDLSTITGRLQALPVVFEPSADVPAGSLSLVRLALTPHPEGTFGAHLVARPLSPSTTDAHA